MAVSALSHNLSIPFPRKAGMGFYPDKDFRTRAVRSRLEKSRLQNMMAESAKSE
jgi:hypothetical protein